MAYRQPFSGDYPITQGYGEKDTSAFHTGIDYACPVGTPILAAEAGIVVQCGQDFTGYGNKVIIQHGDGGAATLCAHLSVCRCYVGQRVEKGQVIGLSGNTGNSTGPHLHFEARTQWDKPGTYFDPLQLPLQNVTDAPKGTTELHFVRAGRVRVVAPWGAKMFDEQDGPAGVAGNGTLFEFFGETKQANGYTYARVVPVNAVRWVAIHDNETQILEEV